VIEVRVRDVRLDQGRPVAVRDTLSVYDLAIDFEQDPADIVAGLRELFQDGVDTGRWTRNRPPYGNDDGSGPN
jgi:hypothetical protein